MPAEVAHGSAGFAMPHQSRSGVPNQQDSWLNKSKVASDDANGFNARIHAGGLGRSDYGAGVSDDRVRHGGLGRSKEEKRSSGSPAEEISDNYDEDDFEIGESMANMDRGRGFLDDNLGGGLDGFNNKSNNMAKASDKESAGDVYAFDDQDDGDFFK